MQIIEISEPGFAHEAEEIVVGIDFGTTNSLIAFSKNGVQEVIAMNNGLKLLPSIISLSKDGQIIVGDSQQGSDYIKSIKRFLAKSRDEILADKTLKTLCSFKFHWSNNAPKIKLGMEDIDLPILAAEIFKHLKKQAENRLSQEVKKAVVSVPAYFGDAARGQIMLAAKIAGLDVIRLMAEPTAAAYAYGLNKKAQGMYLVYDLGGGTFDVSILNMQTGLLQVITTGGDNKLGGDDIDNMVAQVIADILKIEISYDIIIAAKHLKESLSNSNNATASINGKDITLSQKQFEKIIDPLISKTIKIAKDVLFDADGTTLDGIILVGGSTRSPVIEKKLKAAFNTTIFNDFNPDEVVALGAALQAENLSTKPNALLIDVVPLSLGIGLHGGIVEKIIMRNTPMPFVVTKEYTTGVDNQTAMSFEVVQGEREMVTDCRALASFELQSIPLAKAGMIKVEVSFSIDANGILSVTAREKQSGIAHNIEVHSSFNLDEDLINQQLKLAFSNAGIDHENRLLAETKLEAEGIISGIKKAMQETPDVLTENELREITFAINSLQKVINLDNRDSILEQARYLNKLAVNFIQKHLDTGAQGLLEGKNIYDI